MNDRIQIHAQRQPWSRSVAFWIRNHNAIALPLTFKVLGPEDDGMRQAETFECSESGAQAFMDELWREGFRPTEGSGSAGSLAATERHLNDMRALVAKALSTNLPKA